MKTPRTPTRKINGGVVSEATLQRAAARVSPDATRLVSTEVQYLQRTLGSAPTQKEIDAQVVAVRRLPWSAIAERD